MTREEFITLISDEVSGDCSLPFNVPVKTINRVIDQDALKWFYKNYEYSLEDRYLVVPSGYEKKDLFKQERTIKLPDCVYSVYSVRKSGDNFIGDANKDFTYEKFVVQQSGTGASSMGSGPENLVYSTFLMMYLDTVQAMTDYSITFGFNHLTHKLTLNGEIRDSNIILTVAKKIPAEDLFEDEYFIRYVAGKVKMQLGRSLGTVKAPLIGNIEIDFDSIKEEGKEEVQQVVEEINEDDSPDYFMISPQ